MTSEAARFAIVEPGLALSPIPVWVTDIDSVQICWANDAALDLWQAQDRSELYARNLSTRIPPKIRARFQHVAAQVRAGHVLHEEWAFYPQGKPTMVFLELRGILLADGRLAMLNQALPVSSDLPPSLWRTLTAARHLSVIVVFVDAHGTILTHNPAAMAEFANTTSWTSWLSHPDDAQKILRTALSGTTVRMEATVQTQRGERWHVIEAQALRDPVSGELGVLLEHKDETARITVERIAKDQRSEILALSAPILDVGEDALVMPIIGRLEQDRTSEIMTRLMAAITQRHVHHTILDLTGLLSVDEASASRLLGIVKAIRLLGCTAVITGIRSQVARAMVENGFDLTDVTIKRSLADGLQLLALNRNRQWMR